MAKTLVYVSDLLKAKRWFANKGLNLTLDDLIWFLNDRPDLKEEVADE